MSTNLSIPPFEPSHLTLAVPHPTLPPEAPGGADLIGLRPLGLRLIDASLQHFGDRRALPVLQPWPDHLFPGTTVVACLLLIPSQLYQVWCVEPPYAARIESRLRFRPQPVTVARQSIYINPPTRHWPETPPSGLVPQVGAVVDRAGEHTLAG